MACPFPKRRQWTILRATLMILVFLLHVMLLVATALALALGSGGHIQIAAVAFDLGCMGTVALFYLFKLTHRHRRWDRKRNVWAFIALTGLSFAAFVLTLTRIRRTRFGSLALDYAAVGGKDVSNIVIVVSSFAFAFATIGLITAAVSKYEDEEPEKAIQFQFRTGPGFSYPIDGTAFPLPIAPLVEPPVGWTDIRL